MRKRKRHYRVVHRGTGTVIAEGPAGWGITPFEGNLYIRRKYLRSNKFWPNGIPGFCPYKFLYVWLDYYPEGSGKVRSLGWMYWLPNPLLPFIWYRVGLPRVHPDLVVEQFEMERGRDQTAVPPARPRSSERPVSSE